MPKASHRRPLQPLKQACAVPYRWREGQLEFCLITSIRKKRWGFPKGIVDPGETPKQTALKEAWEEAGLRGQIEGRTLGQYADRKWGRNLIVAGYLMHVAEAAETWMESGVRQRCWLPAAEVFARLARKGQVALLENAIERLIGEDRRFAEGDLQSNESRRARSETELAAAQLVKRRQSG